MGWADGRRGPTALGPLHAQLLRLTLRDSRALFHVREPGTARLAPLL